MNSDTPERHLRVSGCPNFRDAGGYATDTGTVAWRRIFRSGHLASLTSNEQHRLGRLDIELIVDLRRADERAQEEGVLSGAKVITAEITPGSAASAVYTDSNRITDATEMRAFMCDINRQFVVSQSEVFAAVFRSLVASDARSVLFHCSAGKDRTGFAIALLHAILGVEKNDLEADYMLSSQYFVPEHQIARIRRKYPVSHLDDASLHPMLETDPTYLQTAFSAIESEFGGFTRYVRDALLLTEEDCQVLKDRFVMEFGDT
ncbi:MAG: tyrosine-protein phosphatase [Pseudomonadota bacterium]